MANEIVKYDNRMNNVAFSGYNANELDILFSIVSVMKDKDTETIELSFEKLRELSNYKQTSNTVFVKDIRTTYKKLLNTSFSFEPKKGVYTEFVLFTEYTVDTNKQTVKIAVNTKFKEVLNVLANNFTRFELVEFTNLNGTYSKQLFKLLKQWKTTGEYTIEINEFRRLMDIPSYYRMSNIDQKVLKPSIKELRNIKDFEYLTVTKIKKGRAVDKLVFEFKEWQKPKPTRKNNRTIEKVQYTLDTEEKADPKAIAEVLAKLKK